MLFTTSKVKFTAIICFSMIILLQNQKSEAKDNSNAFQSIAISAGISVPIAEANPKEKFQQGLGLLSYKYVYHYIFLSADVGGWSDPATGIATVGGGLYFKGFYLGVAVGGINKTNKSLGTKFQFLLSVKYTLPSTPIFIAAYHVSNGNDLFGTGAPNAGEDFLAIGYEYEF